MSGSQNTVFTSQAPTKYCCLCIQQWGETELNGLKDWGGYKTLCGIVRTIPAIKAGNWYKASVYAKNVNCPDCLGHPSWDIYMLRSCSL